MIFPFRANEQLLADWVLAQSGPAGIFPQSKGWGLGFTLWQPPGPYRPLFVFQAQQQDETLLLFPLSPPSAASAPLELLLKFPTAGQRVLLCGQSWAEALVAEAKKLLPKPVVLALAENGAELVAGEFANSRLEFRLQGQSLKPQDLVPQMPVNPALVEDETILTRCFLGLFTQLNRRSALGGDWFKLEELLQESLPLYGQLSRPRRKELENLMLVQLQGLLDGPLKGALVLEHYKKKEGSQPVWRLRLPPVEPGRPLLPQTLRRQAQALLWLKNQVNQTSFYDPQTDPL